MPATWKSTQALWSWVLVLAALVAIGMGALRTDAVPHGAGGSSTLGPSSGRVGPAALQGEVDTLRARLAAAEERSRRLENTIGYLEDELDKQRQQLTSFSAWALGEMLSFGVALHARQDDGAEVAPEGEQPPPDLALAWSDAPASAGPTFAGTGAAALTTSPAFQEFLRGQVKLALREEWESRASLRLAQRLTRRLEMLKSGLELSEDQVAMVRPIFEKYVRDVSKLGVKRAFGELSTKKYRKKHQALSEAAALELQPLLNREQFRALQEMRWFAPQPRQGAGSSR